MPTGVQQSCVTTNDRGGSRTVCTDATPTIKVTAIDRGGGAIQTKNNPLYIPPGSYGLDEVRKSGLLGNIDPATIDTKQKWEAAGKENAASVITPISYVPDRGGQQTGGIPYFSNPQKAANSIELSQIGQARGWASDGDLHGLAGIVGDVVQGVVIAGIAWGGGLAAAQASGGAVGASASTVAGAQNSSVALGNVATSAGGNLISQGIGSVLKPSRETPQTSRSASPGSSAPMTPGFFSSLLNDPVDTTPEQYAGVNPFSNWYIIGAILIALILIFKSKG